MRCETGKSVRLDGVYCVDKKPSWKLTIAVTEESAALWWPGSARFVMSSGMPGKDLEKGSAASRLHGMRKA